MSEGPTLNQTSDEQLMEQFSKGSESAFTVLYQRHKEPLYRYFVRQLNSSQSARCEELYQDVWFAVIDKRNEYSPTAKFTTWLYRIAHNKLIDNHRKSMTENAYLAQISAEPCADEDDREQRKKTAIKDCMLKLPDLQREAFMLRYESDFSPAQICTIVDAAPEAVKTRLRNALSQLRKCLTFKLGSRK